MLADADGDAVETQLWPGELWEADRAQRFHWELERAVRTRSIDRLLAVGIAETGHVTAIASDLLKVPFGAVLTWEDCWVEPLRQPLRFARTLAACDPVLIHTATSASHLRSLGALAAGVGIALAPPEPPSSDESAGEPHDDVAGSYLCTTGRLDRSVLATELLDRISELLAAGHADEWLHAGETAEDGLAPLERHGAAVTLRNCLSVLGRLEPTAVEATIARSRGLVKPAGRVETGVSVLQANRAGIAVSVPPDYPVRPRLPLAIGAPEPCPEVAIAAAATPVGRALEASLG